MADVQQTYSFKFEFNKKDIKKELKEISLDVKNAIAQIGDASDKVVIFKELVSYLSNVDKALETFKNNHKDDFTNLFGNPDKEILGVLTEIFNVTQQSAQAFVTLKDKIAAAESGKADLKTLRGIAEEINALFVAAGQTPKINIDELFVGKGSKANGTDYAGRIKILTDAISDFGVAYSGVQNKLKNGFNFGVGKSSGGIGNNGPNDVLQKEIDALNKQKQEFLDIIDVLNGKSIKINITSANDTKEITRLLNEFREIDSKITSKEFNDVSLQEQNKLLAERLRLATLLKNARDHVNNNGGSNEAFDLVNTSDGMKTIDKIENSLESYRMELQKKANQIKYIYSDLIANIDVKLNQLSIDHLKLEPTRHGVQNIIDLIQEANRIMGEISYDSPNNDLLDAQLDSIRDKVKQLVVSEDQIQRLDDLFDNNLDAPEEMFNELCEILEVDVPRAATKAKESMDDFSSEDNTNKSIKLLKQQLETVHDASQKIGEKEIGFAIDVDGVTYFVESCDNMVKASDEAAVAVRALNENLTIIGHTHPSGGGLFSADDYISAINQRRSGVLSPTMVMGDKYASVLSLADATDDVLTQIENVLIRHGKKGNDAVGQNIISEMQSILSANGMPDALQVVRVAEGMDELATALYKIGNSAQTSKTPLQQLQSLINYYSGNKLSATGVSAFGDYWDAFESGAKNASEVFDEVMSKLGATYSDGTPFNTSAQQYQALGAALKGIGAGSGIGGNGDDGQSSEVAQLEALRQKLVEVQAAVDAKTRAFEEEYVTVDAAVDAEMASLNRLKEELLEIQGILHTVFSISGNNFGNLDISGDNKNVGPTQNAVNGIQQTLSQILTILQGFTGLEAEGKNSLVHKDATAKSPANTAGATDALVGKLDDLATENTLAKIPTAIEELTDALGNKTKAETNTYEDSINSLNTLINALSSTIDSLREVMDGVTQHQKTQKSNTIKAMERIQNPKQRQDITGLAKDSVKAYSDNVEIESLQALANGIVKVEGAFKNVNGEWEGFVVKINESNKAVDLAIKKYSSFANLLTKMEAPVEEDKIVFGENAAINAKAKYNALVEQANSQQFVSSKVVQEQLANVEAAYNNLIEKKQILNKQDAISEDEKAEFKQLIKTYNDAAGALDKIIKNTNKLSNNPTKTNVYSLGSDFEDTAKGREQALRDFISTIDRVDDSTVKFSDNYNKCVFAIKNSDGTVTRMTARFTDARNEIVAMSNETKKATGLLGSLWNEFKGKLKSIGTYLMASLSFHEIFRVIKQGVGYVTEIDSALTELKKVTNETDASYKQFLQDMAKTGSVIGATVKDLTLMASEWARLGYTMEESAKLAKSTAVLLNVSEFTDATEASQALISTMQAFGYAADESEHVVDILNEIGNNYAVSSSGIATALQDSASALMEAGNNLEQSTALVAAANKVVYFVPRGYGNIVA